MAVRAPMDGLIKNELLWNRDFYLTPSRMPWVQHEAWYTKVVSRIVGMTDLTVELLCFPWCHFSFWFPSGSAWAESHSRVLEASRTNCCWLFLPLHIWHVWEVSRCLWDPGLKCASPCPPQLLGRRIQKEEGWLGSLWDGSTRFSHIHR